MPLMPAMAMASYPSPLAVALFYRACLVAAVTAALALFLARVWLAEAARAPDAPSPSTRYRNTLAFWLGALWVLDAVLQAQPLMATRFLGGVVAPLLGGQPTVVADLIRLGMRLWGTSPVWFNVLATFSQLLLGLGLLMSRDGSRLRQIALWLSMAWGLVVWAVGEAFGSLLHRGGALVGSPGSALLYAAAAALLLLPRERWEDAALWQLLQRGFAAFFALLTLLEVLPANAWWTAGGLGGFVQTMARMPQPGIVAAPLAAWADSLTAHPVAWNAAIAASTLALAIAWLVAPKRRSTLYATLAWTLLLWYFGQDFGVLGGMATDPNTGAILLVFGVLWGERLGVFGRARARDALMPGAAALRER
jgi:hypothetical protein